MMTSVTASKTNWKLQNQVFKTYYSKFCFGESRLSSVPARFACPSRRSCGSRSPWSSTCSSPRTAPGCTQRPRRTLARLIEREISVSRLWLPEKVQRGKNCTWHLQQPNYRSRERKSPKKSLGRTKYRTRESEYVMPAESDRE